jgi:hypothetical protein
MSAVLFKTAYASLLGGFFIARPYYFWKKIIWLAGNKY